MIHTEQLIPRYARKYGFRIVTASIAYDLSVLQIWINIPFAHSTRAYSSTKQATVGQRK